ncbi:MAG: SEL1-like repeat protein [Verrucomicrobia bacterium]|nr:SEL1-like repeat protein [Verrucomicrobiota bacterium]
MKIERNVQVIRNLMRIYRVLVMLAAVPLISPTMLGAANAASTGASPLQSQISKWKTAGEKGEAWACFNLGLAYHLGKDVEKNEAEAIRWYLLAAEKGFAAAQANLGYCYETGFGVPVDYAESVKWYQLAAQQGHPFAQYNLGKKYQTGPGVPIDPKMAEKWLRQAAQRNFVPAYFSLGQIYANDTSGNADYREAFKWFKTAAEQGYAPAQHAIGYLYFEGKGVQTNYFEAVKWYSLAASRNFADSHYNLGICYERGFGVPQNLVAAVTHYRTAAEFGHPYAQYSIGVCYYEGKGLEADFLQAYKWWNLSAVQGIPEAASSREILTRLMTESQIKEGQRLASEFVPRQSTAHEGPKPVATPSADVSEIKRVGTGFLVSSDGFLVSTLRTVAGATNIQVITEGGSFTANLVHADPLGDIALLKVLGVFQPLPLVPTRESAVKDGILALGFDNENQGQFNPKVARGSITALLGFQADPRQLTLQPHVAAPFVGTAVVNRHGQVIGMMLAVPPGTVPSEAKDSPPPTVSYALKSEHLINFLRSIPEAKPLVEEPRSGEASAVEEVLSRARAATALIVVL